MFDSISVRECVVTRDSIGGTDKVVVKVWEPYSGHNVSLSLGGVLMGLVGTGQVPEDRAGSRKEVCSYYWCQQQRMIRVMQEALPRLPPGKYVGHSYVYLDDSVKESEGSVGDVVPEV